MRTKSFMFGPAIGAIICCLLLVGGCAEGDDEEPARIKDLNFFKIADNLIFDNRVSSGNTAGETDTRILAWTAPGDDGFDGEAANYDIRYIKQEDLAKWGMEDTPARAMKEKWHKTREVIGEPYPKKGESLEQLFVPRLNPGHTVWFAIRTYDEVGHKSDISNLAGPFRLPLLKISLRETAGDTVDGYGSGVSSAGDMNGDGKTDFLSSNPGTGRVTVTAGKKMQGLTEKSENAQGVKVRSVKDELTPLLTITGATADGFGLASRGIHRIDDNVRSDIGIGAPGYDWGSTVDAGAVYVFYGKKNLPSAMDADTLEGTTTGKTGRLIWGEEAGSGFGSAISPAFDINGDERAEFLVGAPYAFGTGAVYVFRGKGLVSGSASQALLTIRGEQAGDEFGAVVESISDVNGDDVPDIAVGAPGHNGGEGAVYVFYGGNSGVAKFTSITPGSTVLDLIQRPADVTIRGTFAGGRFGKSVTAGGDLSGNADSYYDFAVSGGNTVYVFFGGPSSLLPFPLQGSSVEGVDDEASARLSGTPGEDFGFDIAGVGDINRNGRDDLLVGAPGVSRCYLYTGPVTEGMAWPDPEVMMFEGEAGSGFGASVSPVGDSNGDNAEDFLVGAPDMGVVYYWF